MKWGKWVVLFVWVPLLVLCGASSRLPRASLTQEQVSTLRERYPVIGSYYHSMEESRRFKEYMLDKAQAVVVVELTGEKPVRFNSCTCIWGKVLDVLAGSTADLPHREDGALLLEGGSFSLDLPQGSRFVLGVWNDVYVAGFSYDVCYFVTEENYLISASDLLMVDDWSGLPLESLKENLLAVYHRREKNFPRSPLTLQQANTLKADFLSTKVGVENSQRKADFFKLESRLLNYEVLQITVLEPEPSKGKGYYKVRINQNPRKTNRPEETVMFCSDYLKTGDRAIVQVFEEMLGPICYVDDQDRLIFLWEETPDLCLTGMKADIFFEGYRRLVLDYYGKELPS